MNEHAPSAGFSDAVSQSQAIFHAAMMALARPGIAQPLDIDVRPPAPLPAGLAALALALCDFETTIWLDEALSQTSEVADYLRFHSGARPVSDPAQAQFALIGAPMDLRPFTDFAQGTLDYPDRSTTLIIGVDSLASNPQFRLTGPGIDGTAGLGISPLPHDFAARIRANHLLFPRGVDLLFVAGDRIVGLPRSTKLEG